MNFKIKHQHFRNKPGRAIFQRSAPSSVISIFENTKPAEENIRKIAVVDNSGNVLYPESPEIANIEKKEKSSVSLKNNFKSSSKVLRRSRKLSKVRKSSDVVKQQMKSSNSEKPNSTKGNSEKENSIKINSIQTQTDSDLIVNCRCKETKKRNVSRIGDSKTPEEEELDKLERLYFKRSSQIETSRNILTFCVIVGIICAILATIFLWNSNIPLKTILNFNTIQYFQQRRRKKENSRFARTIKFVTKFFGR